MASSYYSPNTKVTGGALFASWNSKEGSIYFRLLKQIANNQNKQGNFDGKNPLNVKLSQDEAADIIRAVEDRGESKFYHKFESAAGNTVTTGTFKYYEIEGEYEGKKTLRRGFGLSVKKAAGEVVQEVKVGFTLGSAERLSIFLKLALSRIMEAEYAADIQRAKEFNAKKTAAPKEVESKPESAAPEQKEEDLF